MSPSIPSQGRSTRPRGFFRAWTVLLAMFLPFALIFATPTHATAAETSGWGSAHVVMDSMTPDGNCYLAAAYDGPDRVQWANGACWGGLDISPFSGQFTEAGSGVRVAFNGVTSGGSYCGAVSSDMTLGDHADDGATVAGAIPDGSWGLSGGGDCDVIEVCIGLNGGGAAWITDCAPITLPASAVSDACVHGDVLKVSSRVEYKEGYGKPRWYKTIYANVELHRKAGDTTPWRWRALSRHVGSGTWYVTYGTVPAIGGEFVVNPIASDTYSGATDQFELFGMQVFAADKSLYVGNPNYTGLTGNALENASGNTSYSWGNYWTAPQNYATSGPDYAYLTGTTDPSVCRFYIGMPYATAETPYGPTGDDHTEPYRGVNEEPPVGTPPVASPEPEDPIADEPSFWEAMKEFFQSIFGWLSDFPNLFMPSDGYLDAKGQEMKDAWEDTAPGQYVTAFKGLSVGSGVSGCGGIAFAPPFPGVEMDTYYIGEACAGKTAQAAQLVRLGISAAVVVGGGLACIRALGSGFGWNPNVGGKGGEV